MPALSKLTQPPEKYAHLSGDSLYRALVNDDEPWDTARFAQECNRSPGRVRVWIHKRYAVDRGDRVADDRTAPAPDLYSGRSPLWRAGTLRKWMIKVGMMRRDGTYIAHKPLGRARGAADIIPRQRRTAPMKSQAPALLAQYTELTIVRGLAPSAAHAELAQRHRLSVRQVERRLHAALLLAETEPLTDVERAKAEQAITASVLDLLTELTDSGMTAAAARAAVARELGMSATSVQRIASRVSS